MSRIVNKFAALVGSVAGSVYKGFTETRPVKARPLVAAAPASGIPSPQGMAWARRTVEKVRSNFASGRLRFLPHWNLTGTSPEARREFRQMWREPVVKAGVASKVEAVASLPVQAHAEDPDDPRQRANAEFTAWALRQMEGGTRALTWELGAHCLMDGHVIPEKVWRSEPVKWGRWAGKRVYRCLKAKNPDWIIPKGDAYGNVEGYYAGGNNAGATFPASDFAPMVHMPLFGSPFGQSDFDAAHRGFWTKRTLLDMWGLHLDKYTGPYLKGTYQDEDKRASLEAAMEEARAHTWVSVPVGTLIECLDMSTKGTADFQSAVEKCDQDMLIGIAFASLHILEGKIPDARGDTSVQKSMSELPEWMLAAAVGDTVTQHMAPELTEVNFHGVPPATVTWGSVNENDMLLHAKLEQLLQQMGYNLSRKAGSRFYSIQEATDPADVLKPPTPPASPASPGVNGNGKPPGPGGNGKPPQLAPGGGEGIRPFAGSGDEDYDQFCGGPGSGIPGPCPEGGADDKGEKPTPTAKAPKSAKDVRKRIRVAEKRQVQAMTMAKEEVARMQAALSSLPSGHPEVREAVAKAIVAARTESYGIAVAHSHLAMKLAFRAVGAGPVFNGLTLAMGGMRKAHALAQEGEAAFVSAYRLKGKLKRQPGGKPDTTLSAPAAEPYDAFCGGPGSGIPGPCPTGRKEYVPKVRAQRAVKGRGTVADVVNDVRATLAKGLTPETAKEVSAKLLTLSKAEIHQAKKQLGLKAGGNKADLARKLGERAAANAAPPGGKAKAMPEEPTGSLTAESRPALSDAQVSALDNYTASAWVNDELRGVPLRDSASYFSDERRAEVKKELASAFAKTKPMPQPVQVHRGMYFETPGERDQFLNGMKASASSGNSLVLPGYTSTTTSKDAANGYMVGNSVRMDIRAVEGLDMKHYDSGDNAGELLLPDRSQFVVHGVHDDNGVTVVRMSQVRRKP